MSELDPRRRLGAFGEALARRHLEARGLEILDANYRTRYGELDLVAADRSNLVFCEVKSRLATRPCPLTLEMIGPGKRRRLRMMAREWLSSRAPLLGGWDGHEIRFDAIGVTVAPDGGVVGIDHVPDAF